MISDRDVKYTGPTAKGVESGDTYDVVIGKILAFDYNVSATNSVDSGSLVDIIPTSMDSVYYTNMYLTVNKSMSAGHVVAYNIFDLTSKLKSGHFVHGFKISVYSAKNGVLVKSTNVNGVLNFPDMYSDLYLDCSLTIKTDSGDLLLSFNKALSGVNNTAIFDVKDYSVSASVDSATALNSILNRLSIIEEKMNTILNVSINGFENVNNASGIENCLASICTGIQGCYSSLNDVQSNSSSTLANPDKGPCV